MNPQETKIVFFGTPKFAAEILQTLIESKYNISAVFTQPDKKFGRSQEMKKSAAKELAEKKSIPVFEPQNLERGKAKDEISQMRPDLIVVAAYGKILPKGILEIPKFGAINIHASLLPKFRGASPVQEAILSGEKKTGITLMLMNEKMDSGEIINQEEIGIEADENTLSLTEKLARAGGKILVETLPLWIGGAIKGTRQNEKEAAYCRTVKKEDGKINWNDPAEKIFRKWRAYFRWPGIFTFLPMKNGKKRLKLVEIGLAEEKIIGEIPGKVVKYNSKIAVQTGKGFIILEKIQLEGKKITDAEDFAKGNKEFLNSVLV
ncbi:MAG: methionyl-tRNA formyltransferase [Candidatus Moranbacteria bacterium RIFOXYB1_FULL_43_19]